MIFRLLKAIFSIILAVAVFATPVLADIDGMLDNIVSGVYVQEPGVYKSPSASTMSMGSVSFRLKNDTMGRPVFGITPPRATLSCSGMDFDAGMISMLNLDMFEKMLSQSGASLAWGIMIGLVYSVPGIGKAYKMAQEYARLAQKIFQSPCEVGKAIGSSLGDKLWDKGAVDKASDAMRSGEVSVYQEALKSIAKHLEVGDFVQTFPYGSLQKAGITDRDIQDLLASWFGILDIWLKDNNGNRVFSLDLGRKLDSICGDQCSAENIGFKPYPRLVSNIDSLMHGGRMKVYSCQGSISGSACDGGVGENEKIITGLSKKIKDKLVAIRDDLGTVDTAGLQSAFMGTLTSGSAPQEGATGAEIYAFSRVVPNFFDVMSYSAILQKSEDPALKQMANTVIGNTAEFIALQLILQVARQAREVVGNSVGGDSKIASSLPWEVIGAYIRNIDEGERAVYAYAKDINDIYQMHVNSFNTYKSLSNYTQESIVKTFGKGISLFK